MGRKEGRIVEYELMLNIFHNDWVTDEELKKKFTKIGHEYFKAYSNDIGYCGYKLARLGSAEDHCFWSYKTFKGIPNPLHKCNNSSSNAKWNTPTSGSTNNNDNNNDNNSNNNNDNNNSSSNNSNNNSNNTSTSQPNSSPSESNPSYSNPFEGTTSFNTTTPPNGSADSAPKENSTSPPHSSSSSTFNVGSGNFFGFDRFSVPTKKESLFEGSSPFKTTTTTTSNIFKPASDSITPPHSSSSRTNNPTTSASSSSFNTGMDNFFSTDGFSSPPPKSESIFEGTSFFKTLNHNQYKATSSGPSPAFPPPESSNTPPNTSPSAFNIGFDNFFSTDRFSPPPPPKSESLFEGTSTFNTNPNLFKSSTDSIKTNGLSTTTTPESSTSPNCSQSTSKPTSTPTFNMGFGNFFGSDSFPTPPKPTSPFEGTPYSSSLFESRSNSTSLFEGATYSTADLLN